MAYVNKKRKEKLIKYINDVLEVLAASFRHQNSVDFDDYVRRYYDLKGLLFYYIEQL